MATETIRRSDLSGVEIPEGKGARVRVMFYDDRDDLRADLTDAEVKKLLSFAQPVQPRPARRGSKRLEV